MQRHALGIYTPGVVEDPLPLRYLCDLIVRGVEPRSTPVEYEEIGVDLNGVPIEAGFGQALWEWDLLRQEDYNFLLAFQGNVAGATFYVRTSKRSGASGIDFDNYTATVHRPTFDSRIGLQVQGVKIQFTQMVVV